MKYFQIYFYFYIIINVLSQEILKKDGSIKTNNGYVIFDSSTFVNGDEMYFELDAKSWCDENLYYQFFDNIDSIQYYSQLKYSVRKEASSSTTINGAITSYTLYFTIEKIEAKLDGLKGDYLLLQYDCDKSSVEFSNTKTSGKTKVATIAIIVVVVFIVFVVGIILLFCFCCKRRRISNMIYEQNYPYQVSPYYTGQVIQPQYPYPYGNVAIVYQNPNMITPNNQNYNYGVVPQNAQIVQNGASPPPSSNPENNLQKLEKPKA